jgi:hypothetical protein
VTCGLDHILFPESDPNDTYGYPGRTETEYGLHGRVANTPAILRSHGERWEGAHCTLHADGEVRQAGGLAETLVLRRRVEVDLDGLEIRWRDEVTNEGHLPAPHMLLYHLNLGAPLLGPSCELHAPIREVRFATPTATGAPDEHLHFQEPQADFVEQAFSHAMAADESGIVSVLLLNRDDPAEPWGVRLRYEAANFPYFFQWRYLAAGTYVVGLEPSTNGLAGRAGARADGELTMLEPGQARTYATSLEVVVGREDTDAAIAAIAALTERELAR